MIQTIVIIVLSIMLILVSLCYFFDTRKYKKGTVHSENEYNSVRERLSDMVNEYAKLLNKYQESIHKHTVALEELRSINKTLNEELDEKDLKLAAVQNKIDILKSRLNSFAGESDNEKEKAEEED